MKIAFHGADQSVTGSCHLVICGGKQILIDCGLYQGGRELTEENHEPFCFDPSKVDYLLLTHAHLDHCGRIPLLVKQGFQGEIITTAASRELAKLVMLDAAHLQEEEADWQSRKVARHGYKKNQKPEDIAPLYSTLDALNSLDYFGRKAEYGKALTLDGGIQATFWTPVTSSAPPASCWSWKRTATSGACCSPVTWVTAVAPFCAIRHRRLMPTWS